MSYNDGWAALNLEMPERVPRTEYSVDRHWELVKAVTGIDVSFESTKDIQEKARDIFVSPAYWNFDLFWATPISMNEFGDLRTKMGHAVYADGGVDYANEFSCPFDEPEDVLKFDPLQSLPMREHGKLVTWLEGNYRSRAARSPDGANMTGTYISCMSGLIELFGWDMLLLAAGIDPQAFGALANRYAEWMQHYYNALADTDIPLIMIHDDIVWSEGAFIHPDWYRQYIFPNYKKYMEPLLDSGKKVLYTSDANYTEFVDDIVDCGFHGFVMEPMTDMKYIAEKYGKTHVFIGNSDTRILLSGTKEEIRAEVERCMAIGKHCPGFFMAVGNHIPANTPIENAIYYNDVYQELSRR